MAGEATTVCKEFLHCNLVRFDRDTVPVSQIMGDSNIVCLLFGAAWCMPSRHFVPILYEAYRDIRREYGRDALEVVYVPRDKTFEDWRDFFGQMPWVSLPWESDVVYSLKAQFGVKSLPRLVALNKQGGVVVPDARGGYGFGFGCDSLAAYNWILRCAGLATREPEPVAAVGSAHSAEESESSSEEEDGEEGG